MSQIAAAGSARKPGLGLVCRALVPACSALALAVGVSTAALAQDGKLARSQTDSQTAHPDLETVVVSARFIVTSLKDVPVETIYDQNRVASYAFSTIGELVAQIRAENGDDESSILVNGVPIADIGDIADFPVEAVQRIEALPRGAATRIGGQAGQRAYNIVLKPQVRSATLTGSRQIATEGGATTDRAEILGTLIDGQDRVNLVLRAVDNGPLFENDRALIPFREPVAYSATGNILPLSGSEIDPAFSALAGLTVGTLALPGALTGRPTLAQLLPGANGVNPGDDYRTLRGAGRTYEAGVSGSKPLTTWLTLSLSGDLNWNKSASFNGLPTGSFLIPAGSAFNPFSQSVILALNDPARPLRNLGDSNGRTLSTTLNAFRGEWRGSLRARIDERNRTSSYDLLAPVSGAFLAYDPATNPFAGSLGATIPVMTSVSRSTSNTRELTGEAEGPLFTLPAGPLLVHLDAGIVWTRLAASDPTNGNTAFRRQEKNLRAGVSIPLLGPDWPATKALGEADLALDAGRLDLGSFGRIDRLSTMLNWQPREWIQLSGGRVVDGQPAPPQSLAEASVTTPNVPYFDPLTDQTVLVTTISGGAANLANEKQRDNQLSLSLSPWAEYNVLVNFDYTDTVIRNQIGGLPLPTAAVVAAFPDRFVRDAAGQLILVDSRPVNFDRYASRALRSALDFTVPLFDQGTGPHPTLQVHAAYTYMIENSAVIRAGLGTIDLLKGGAIGIGGGGQRNSIDASAALNQGGNGIRLNMVWRGPSYLVPGTSTAPDRITFGAFAKFDLRAFADLGSFLPDSSFAEGMRVTLAIENLGGGRQGVVADSGVLPLVFQPIYRDPIGRTVSLELRKAF